MKLLSTLNIIPDLPEKYTSLWDQVANFWWTWDQEAVRALRSIDPATWDATEGNPLLFLSSLDQEHLARLEQDSSLDLRLQNALRCFAAYCSGSHWYATRPIDPAFKVAYFSTEFGLAPFMPTYSGGMGILAGDSLKSASDLGLPLVGISLLYRQGYFQQALNPDGWQVELYPEINLDQMPLRLLHSPSGEALIIEVSYPEQPVYAQIWSTQVGRVPLYLLDTNLEINRPEDREITAHLYGGDREMRIRQEILLGIGGLRALHALGIQPSICHMNEGHSAFLALERIRTLMEEENLSFAEAREASTAGNVFTTHTPVAAGNDWFPTDLVEAYLSHYREELGLSSQEFLGLGRLDPDDDNSAFCMTVLALRLSAHANAVSRLHGQVSRKMWRGLWPQLTAAELPIISITNGVHLQSWIAPELARLFERYLGPSWHSAEDAEIWQALERIPDQELWQAHQACRQRLIDYIYQHHQRQRGRRGTLVNRIHPPDLDPRALTIGFARRFATYKRATLLLRDIKRFVRLCASENQPLQIIFAGKAHPHDHAGKELIREIVRLTHQQGLAGRLVFLENYDMHVARYLVQGCDVWLNTPRRPQEASGTSGMKGAVNGILNISVLDGWWDEAVELHSGWAIGRGEEYEDPDYQDAIEANHLYSLLEKEVIPLFYQRGEDGLPHAWIARMKQTIAALAPVFNTHRMMREYAELLYEPNHQRWKQLNSDRERVNQLTRWKAHVRSHWSQVHIERVEFEAPPQPKVGMRIPLRATVVLGALAPSDVKVELYTGKVNAQHEIQQALSLSMEYAGSNGEGQHLFAGEFPCTNPGTYGYTLRVLPNHQDLKDPLELGLVRWAQEP